MIDCCCNESSGLRCAFHAGFAPLTDADRPPTDPSMSHHGRVGVVPYASTKAITQLPLDVACQSFSLSVSDFYVLIERVKTIEDASRLRDVLGKLVIDVENAHGAAARKEESLS